MSASYAIAHAWPIHVTVFAPPSSCISIESLFFNLHNFVGLFRRIWQSQDNAKWANIMRAIHNSGSIVFHSDAQSITVPVSRFCTCNCCSLWDYFSKGTSVVMSYYPVVAYPEYIVLEYIYINCLHYMLGSGVLRFYVLHQVFRK